MENQEEPHFDRIEDQLEGSNATVMSDSQISSKEKAPVILSPSIYSNYTKKNLKAMESIHAKDAERATCIQFCRDTITALADRHHLQRAHIETLLSDRDYCNHLFRLFDTEGAGFLAQDEWIATLKENIRNHSELQDDSTEEKTDIVELLEAIAYLICIDEPVRPETFHKILSSRGIPAKILRLADTNHDGAVSVEEMMNFIMVITNPRRNTELTAESIKHLEKVFRENLAKDKDEFTLSEFKRIVPSKNPFFVERAFRIFDRDKNGSVSMAEFIDTMHQFAGTGVDEKLVFLFKVYDLDDDGLIQQSDLREVMKACMEENGMRFDDKEIEGLAQALYEDAAGLAAGEEPENCPGITVDDLKAELAKHDGLLENLSINIGKWLVPPSAPRPKTLSQKFKDSLPPQFSMMYWRNNRQFVSFLSFMISVNIILFVHRAYYFKDFSTLSGAAPNGFYMMSRANGRTLLFNSTLILVLVLRYTITKLRELGLAVILPVDNNIYLHKVCGWVIFIQSLFHTVMHLCNFAINVQPGPVRFVQLTTKYWEEFGDKRPGWLNLGYNLPPGCTLSNITSNCPDGFLDPKSGVSFCQYCPDDAEPWSYYEWLLTMKPGMFGLIHGIANPTGISLMIVMTIMVVCSLPFVRRGGYFEVFYFTHLLYFGYYVLLVLHAPEFWKWLLVPGMIFLLELTYRILSSLMGKGKTNIFAGVVLPSKVTNLIIKRPHNFNFTPGDWVFVKIPAIAKSEWHPFTISSAPEQVESFTLHIRGVGQWTNRLYEYFEEEYRRQQEGKEDEPSGIDRFRGTVHRKYNTVKNGLSVYVKGHRPVERDSSDPSFQSIANKYQHDPAVQDQRSRQRMRMREERLRARESNGFSTSPLPSPASSAKHKRHQEIQSAAGIPSNNKSFRYMRRQPSIVQFAMDDAQSTTTPLNSIKIKKKGKDNFGFVGAAEELGMVERVSNNNNNNNNSKYDRNSYYKSNYEDGVPGRKLTPGKKMTLNKPLEIFIDGPFGAPSSNIFRAEHAVLIGTGIGVTPFASILQSIMHRYWNVKRNCPRCDYQWSDELHAVFNLKKVDFYWINREQKSFEWFVKLLSQLEIEQSEQDGVMGHFLDMHMYITSALQRTDMKAVGLQLALDLLHEKEKRDLVTGLKSRTIAGRPNWNKVFTQIREQRKGRITVFYCGNPSLAKIVRTKCNEFGFIFRKEVF